VLHEVFIDELRSDRLLELSLDCGVVLICIGKLVREVGEPFNELSGGDGFVGARHERKRYLE